LLTKRLQDHALGKLGMTESQRKAIEVLLKKTLPDLQSIEATIGGKDGVLSSSSCSKVTFQPPQSRLRLMNCLTARPTGHALWGSRSGKTLPSCAKSVSERRLPLNHATSSFDSGWGISSPASSWIRFPRLCVFAGPPLSTNSTSQTSTLVMPMGQKSGLVDWTIRTGREDSGNEYVTIYFNECSQIPYSSRNVALTRLAQKIDYNLAGLPKRQLPLKVFYDENPPDKGHWTYRLFKLKQDPRPRLPYPMQRTTPACN